MEHEVDSRVLQLQVFLPAMGTKAIFHGMTAVEAILFLSDFLVAHGGSYAQPK